MRAKKMKRHGKSAVYAVVVNVDFLHLRLPVVRPYDPKMVYHHWRRFTTGTRGAVGGRVKVRNSTRRLELSRGTVSPGTMRVTTVQRW